MSLDHAFDSFAVEADARARVGQSAGERILTRLMDVGMIDAAYQAAGPSEEPVVVRFLHRVLASDYGLRDAYVPSARVANQVGHPAVPRILEDGIGADGTPYVVTPLLVGQPAIRSMERPMPAGKALRLARDVLEVLEVAHGRGIVHGALTPTYIFVADDGHVNVLGFGLAPLRARVAHRAPGYSLLSWAPPEQRHHGAVAAGPAADLWSLGAIVVALLLGATTPTDADEFPPLSALAPDAPVGLARLLDRALSVEPEYRFTDAATMRALVVEAMELHGHYVVPRAASRPRPSAARASPSSRYRFAEATTEPAGPRPRRPSSRAPAARPLVHARTVPSLRHPSPPASLAGHDMNVFEARASTAGVPPSKTEPGALRDVFRLLDDALAARARRGGNPENDGQYQHFCDRLVRLAAGTEKGLVWTVVPYAFVAGDEIVWEPEGALSAVPFELFADGVRRITLSPAVDRAEVHMLVQVMTHDVDDLHDEDDLVTLLWEADFQHITCEAVDSFVAEDPEAAEAVETERRRVLGLARFDTSLQLEECWQAYQKALAADAVEGAPVSERLRDRPSLPIDSFRRSAVRARLHGEQEAPVPLLASTLARVFTDAWKRGEHAAVCSPIEGLIGQMASTRLERAIDVLETTLTLLRREGGADEIPAAFCDEVLSQYLVSQLILAADHSSDRGTLDRLSTILERARLDGEKARTLLFAATSPVSRALAVRCLARSADADVSALLSELDRDLALVLVRALRDLGTPEAMRAIEVASEHADPVVRLEALNGSSSTRDRFREELRALLEDADAKVRMSTLAAIRERGLKAAGPILVLRARSPSFDKLAAVEKRALLETVVQLMPSRAESVCLELIQSTSLVSAAGHDESRVIAAEVLARVARSAEVAEALDAEARKYLRNSVRVRQAVADAAALVRESLPPPTKDRGNG